MYMKRVCALLLAGLLFLACTACHGEESASPGSELPADSSSSEALQAWSYAFTDDTGRRVELTEQPETVAVLFSSFADMWALAGGRVDVTVAEAVERGFADDTAVLVDDGAGKTIDMERLLAAEPDLVIATADLEGQVSACQLAGEAGVPAAMLHVESLEDYLRVLKIFTDITGDAQAYETYGAQVQQAAQEVLEQAREAAGEDAPRILFIRAGSKASATKAKTAEDHFACQMLAELGVHNIAEDAPVLLDGLSLEEILLQDPDYIFISTMGSEEEATAYMESVFQSEGWGSLTAVKEGNYVFLPKELFHFKPNARWAEAYEYLAGLLYPELAHEG